MNAQNTKTIRLFIEDEEIGEQDRPVDVFPFFEGDTVSMPDGEAYTVFAVDGNDLLARQGYGNHED